MGRLYLWPKPKEQNFRETLPLCLAGFVVTLVIFFALLVSSLKSVLSNWGDLPANVIFWIFMVWLFYLVIYMERIPRGKAGWILRVCLMVSSLLGALSAIGILSLITSLS
jgi:hypothetical protein